MNVEDTAKEECAAMPLGLDFVEATYDAATDSYDHPANSYWARYGRRTVERLALKRGEHVLDVCCGSGASALPAAEMVGAEGRVLGVDLSGGLLELAGSKAVARGHTNVAFFRGDMLDLCMEHGRFDAVVCVFGIFFVPDRVRAVGELWRMVRPGGRLAITTWGSGLYEPMASMFWEAVRSVRPDLHRGFNPWDDIATEGALRELMESVGSASVGVRVEAGWHAVDEAGDCWRMVMGSGLRGTVEQLSWADRDFVRRETLAGVERAGVERVRVDVLYGATRKASGRGREGSSR